MKIKKTHRTETPTTPAYAFVTLDPTQKYQFFREKVIEISDFVKTLLANYGSARGGQLDFPEFQSRFLKQANVQETVFYFVYGVFRLKKLVYELYPKMKHNVFSSLLEANTLFDTCLVVDTFIKSKYSNPQEAAHATFGAHLTFLSANREHGLLSPLSFVGGRVGELRNAFIRDFANALQNLLNSNFRFADGSTLRPIEEDFAIAYGVRNFGGHRIENQPVIYKNLEELCKRILNTLFFLVENCA